MRKIVIFILACFFFMLTPSVTFACTYLGCSCGLIQGCDPGLICQPLSRSSLVFSCQRPAPSPGDIGGHYAFGDIMSLGQGLDRLVVPLIALAIVAVIIYFLIGSFKILTAGGDAEAVEGGKQMITHAIIGFVMIIFIFLILQFLPEAFGFNSLILF